MNQRLPELQKSSRNAQNALRVAQGSLLTELQLSLAYLSRNGFEDDSSRQVVATASRTFTFYSVPSFRHDYHAKRVLPSNIMAFPEPEEEVIKLFGRNIALHYFVVRLSLRNTDAEDRLVSSGMVRAKGRAIVESPTKSGVPLRFTVPVEVAPHSAQQIYSILSDEAVNEPRAVVFRAFELAGAVASAYTLSFGADTFTKDAIQLATGIGVPAFSKFWTDRLPGYQRNIVNFAMDDLVKIPKGGVTSHKFLFFPKDKIEGDRTSQTAPCDMRALGVG